VESDEGDASVVRSELVVADPGLRSASAQHYDYAQQEAQVIVPAGVPDFKHSHTWLEKADDESDRGDDAVPKSSPEPRWSGVGNLEPGIRPGYSESVYHGVFWFELISRFGD